MATAELSVVHLDAAPVRPSKQAGQPGQPLHRIQDVRLLQGMSLRTAARQLKTDIRSIRAQEQGTTDLRLSDLYKWQEALDVPVSELLVEDDAPLSRPVQQRAQLVKVMKTARALQEAADSPSTARMAGNLILQLQELMPELAEVSPWPAVGNRRSLDEIGRIAEQSIDDSFGYGGDLAE